MEKLLSEDRPHNVFVHVVMRGKDKQEYECVGVLTQETENAIQIAFNIKAGVVVDDIEIPRSDIINITVLDRSYIKEF